MEITIKELVENQDICATATIYINCITEDYCFKPSPYLKALNPDTEIEGCLAWLAREPKFNRIIGAFVAQHWLVIFPQERSKRRGRTVNVR